MSTITVSSKYQIVIPLKIREALGIKPGEKLHAIEYRGRIELVPVRPTKSARGSLKGIDTDVPRESDRVLMSSIPRLGSNTSPTGLTLQYSQSRSNRRGHFSSPPCHCLRYSSGLASSAARTTRCAD